MNRREFLGTSVFAATAGLAIDACAPDTSELIPILIPEESFVPGDETFLPSTCQECAAGCGLLVRKIDGRLVKVEGNPAHPVSRGGVCARGQALPQVMYHPDRIQGPLVREGARGSGSWKNVTWEEALDRIATELSASLTSDEDPRLGFVTAELSGHREAMVQRFLAALGRSAHYVHEPLPTATARRAHALATGHASLIGCDLSGAAYALSFGAELLESHLSPVGFARGLAEMRRGRPGRRGKLVMAGPRLSLTAAKADEWVPVVPGMELALALAVTAVILERDLYDRGFVQASSSGLDAYQSFVAERARPAEVAEKTGIPLGRIERIATELCEQRPSIVFAGAASTRTPSGLALALTVSHLNALVGAYGADGLLRFGARPPTFSSLPPLESPMPESLSLASALEQRASLGRVVFVAGTDPLYSLPPGFDAEAQLGKAPLVVSFSSFHDDTTRFADVVLPESTSFERYEDGSSSGFPDVVFLSAPLLARPLYETRSMPDALLALAKRLSLDDAFPWESYEDVLRDAWKALPTSWDEAVAAGGLFSSGEPDRSFATPDRRYHFELDPLSSLDLRESPPELSLHVYASTAFGHGRSAHLPFLQELADPITGVRWGSVVEIAETTAAARGIAGGDLVEVRAGDRVVRARAHVGPGIHPSVVALALGQGHVDYGRYARGRGVNAYSLFEPSLDEDGFLLTAPAIEIRKVTT